MPRRGLIWAVGVFSVVAAGCTDPTQSDEYLQLESHLVDVQLELADVQIAAEEAAAKAESDMQQWQADVASLEDELARTERDLESRTESLGLVRASIEHLIAWDLWIDPNVVSELESLGADLSLANQILNDRGWGDSWVRYVEEQGWDAVTGTRPTGVTELDRAWVTFVATQEGSDEEFVAIWDYTLRLLAMLLEQSERITFE